MSNPNGTSTLVECINEDCGNETHPMIPECGDCMDEMGIITTRYQRAITTTRRNFNSGY